MRCEICDLDPCETLGFCESCRRADAKPKAESGLPPYWESMDVGTLAEELQALRSEPHAATSTLQAVDYLMRVGDQERLERFIFERGRSQEQIIEILNHIEQRQPSHGRFGETA
jgi:hypothetical protein